MHWSAQDKATIVVPILAALALVLPATASADFAEEGGSPVPVGNEPFWVAPADFNGDGRPDLAVANDDSAQPRGSVSVLLRQPGGGFLPEPGSPIAVGRRPDSVAVGDFNGDGRPDMAVANFFSDSVSVLLRQAGGGFAEEAGSPFPIGSAPHSVVAADFNGDGRPDLAAPDWGSGQVTVLLRQPGGGFAEEAGSPISVGSGPAQLGVADFDGDGRRDLAVANHHSGHVTILLRQAGGGFAEEIGSPIPVGALPVAPAVGDFDGDGRPDLAVTAFGSNDVTVLLRQPGGGFAREPGAPIAVGQGAYGASVADLNRDGRPDLAVTGYYSGDVTILLRKAGGGFAEAPFSPVAVGSLPLVPGAADLNGDGRVDLAVPNNGGASVSVLLNLPDTAITTRPPAATKDATPSFAFDSSDPVATFECRLDDGDFDPCDSPYAAASLPDGGHTFRVRAVDDLGNWDPTPAEAEFRVDTVPPETTITNGPGDGATSFASPTYEFAASEPGSTFACALTFSPGTLVERRTPFACSSPATTPQPSEGASAFTVYAIDAAGNADQTPATRTINLVLPPRNTALPSIAQLQGAIGGGKPDPHSYICRPGTWEGRDPGRPYRFSWQRLTRDDSFLSGYRVETVATGETYRAATEKQGDLVQKSWLFRCVAEAANQAGSASATSPDNVLDPVYDPFGARPPYGNFRVRGIDVFQVVQPTDGAQIWDYPGNPSAFPVSCGGGTPTSWVSIQGRCDLGAESPGFKHYAGVELDRREQTTAVVYVDMDGIAAIQPGQQLQVTLSLVPDGKPSDVPRSTTITAPPVSTTPFVTAAERANRAFGVQFVLPGYWLCCTGDDRVDLKATVEFVRQFGQHPHQCDGGCKSDDTFTLWDLPLVEVPKVRVESVELRKASDNWIHNPQQVLRRAAQVYPGGEAWSIFDSGADISINDILVDWTINSPQCKPWKQTNDLQGCLMDAIGARLGDWEARNRPSTSLRDVLMGIHANDTAGDWKIGGTGSLEQPVDFWHPTIIVNNGDLNRPLTSAAHEFGHAIGLPHAGKDFSPPTGPGTLDLSCGGDAGDQVGEDWPPDHSGRLQGIEFDSTSATPPVRVSPIVDGNGGNQLFDLMSYCPVVRNATPPDKNHWLSARNWSHTLSALKTWKQKPKGAQAARAVGSARRNDAFAVGVIGPDDGGRIDRVVPLDASSQPPPPTPDSPVRLRSLDAAGGVLTEVGVELHTLIDRHGSAGGSFAGPVRADAAAVELVRDGAVLHRLQRSRPPRVRVLSPGPGQRVRGGPKSGLVVRWSASDPDGDALYATVDYSPDAGRTWTTVFQGPNVGRARISGRALAGSRRARMRIGVNDGFVEPRALTGIFTADGTRPAARIARPQAREPLSAGGRTVLTGSALDDRHREIRGPSLTWYAGRKRLGHGQELAVRLPAGRYPLRLVARDRGGRTGVARLRVRVQRPPLRLIRIGYPQKVAPRARELAVRIAASERAILRATGRRYRVGTRARRIVLPHRAGREPVCSASNASSSPPAAAGCAARSKCSAADRLRHQRPRWEQLGSGAGGERPRSWLGLM